LAEQIIHAVGIRRARWRGLGDGFRGGLESRLWLENGLRSRRESDFGRVSGRLGRWERGLGLEHGLLCDLERGIYRRLERGDWRLSSKRLIGDLKWGILNRLE
jgi:hypothetical protein